jgi:hypothetical protein
VSPIKKNNESGKAFNISKTPARFRVAGADRRPSSIDRPAYDFSFKDPNLVFSPWTDQVKTTYIPKGNCEMLKKSFNIGNIANGPLD